MLGAIVAVACSSSGEGGRVVEVTLSDDGCTPITIDAKPGEKLNLKAKNDTGGFYEVEGIEGTQLEEVIIPEGRTREIGYNVPDSGGTFPIKCYVPAGVSTIMEVRAGEGSGPATTATSAGTSGAAAADDTVKVDLTEYDVTPDKDTVEAGLIRFEATNISASMVHELAVLRVAEGGSVDENRGESKTSSRAPTGSRLLTWNPATTSSPASSCLARPAAQLTTTSRECTPTSP